MSCLSSRLTPAALNRRPHVCFRSCRDNFDRIRRQYVVADPSRSFFLAERQIRRLAPDFVAVLSRIMGRTAERPIDLISRYGAELNPHQIEQLKIWLATA